MNEAAADISGRLRRIVTAQLVVAGVLAAGVLVVYGVLPGLSVLYGGLVDLVLALLLARNVRKAEAVAATDPKGSMTVLYVGAVQRFFLLIAMLAAGLALLRLNAVAVAAGFVAARIAQVAGARDKARIHDEEGLK
ncbi:MAG: ATP synthase subunit I [Pseudomonadota bacterium]